MGSCKQTYRREFLILTHCICFATVCIQFGVFVVIFDLFHVLFWSIGIKVPHVITFLTIL